MKTHAISRLCRSLALSIAATGLVLAAGADKSESRPPLKLSVDAKPIDRTTAERVSYSPIVKKTAPSVVYVFSSKKAPARDASSFYDDPTFRRFFNLPDPGRGGRAPSQPQQGLGSGVIVSADGYIVTNHHVVDEADEVKVAFGEPRKEYKATVVGSDAGADVALLKIDAKGLPAATLGDSDQLEVGDVVLAIGNPFGVGQSVSRGIVSALSRGGLGIERYEDFIQTDAAINPGNSGGALLDTAGRLIGVNVAILSRSGGFNGIGFAIPSNQVRGIVDQLAKHGRVERAMLGVDTQPLESDLTELFKVDGGALIAEVRAGSAAEKSGLKSGDIITKVDGTTIKDNRHLQNTITRFAPGTEVTVEYVRDGKTEKTKAKLTRLPDKALASNEGAAGGDDGVLNGVAIDELTAQMRRQLRVPERVDGVVVTQVDPKSASARAGIREGDVISSLDRRPITDVKQAVKLSEEIKGPKVLVQLWRGGSSRFLVVDESK
ncbi:MAG: Do family serine endopeptidase [Verrucomicrobia bacterium]|nr:Do family serine endopeptidase [Verrucomicrobiota bacterium]